MTLTIMKCAELLPNFFRDCAGRRQSISSSWIRKQTKRSRPSVGYMWARVGDREVVPHPKGSVYLTPVLKGSSRKRFLDLVKRFEPNHPKVLALKKKFGY